MAALGHSGPYRGPSTVPVLACTRGGTMYGMKTTLYLPADIKGAVELEARRRGVSEAEVVREALRKTLMTDRVRPRAGIIRGHEPIAQRVDELLAEGFGS